VSNRPIADVMRKRFFAWKTRHPREAEDQLAVWSAAWADGAWDALERTAELAALVPRLEELIAIYREAAIERELQPSAYWHDEGLPT